MTSAGKVSAWAARWKAAARREREWRRASDDGSVRILAHYRQRMERFRTERDAWKERFDALDRAHGALWQDYEALKASLSVGNDDWKHNAAILEAARLDALSALKQAHQVLQGCDALIDCEEHPELSAQIAAILRPCSESGVCPTFEAGERVARELRQLAESGPSGLKFDDETYVTLHDMADRLDRDGGCGVD